MEQASKIYEELEDADDAILGEDEVCKLQLSEDDALQKNPQDDESKPGEEEQRDSNEIASDSISHVEETSGQDVRAISNDDTAESTFPKKAPEVGQSQPELVAAMDVPVPDVEDKAKVDADQESGALAGNSLKPDSCNQGGKEVQESLTEAAQDSVKEYEEEGQSASSEQSLEKKGITEETSEIPGLITDVGDGVQVGADKDATVLSESVSPPSSSQNQGEEPLATLTMDDQGSGEGHDGIDKDTPGEQDMAKGDGPEGSSAVQMMSEQEETDISAMEEVAERGDEGWSEDITGDNPPLDSQQPLEAFLQETTEPIESELVRESGLDAEMDTSEPCPDGDKETDVGERTVEIQEAGGDAPRVDNVEGFNDETGDGGQLGTDLNEEDERVLDQQITDDIEGGGNVGEEGMDHNEKPLTTQEEDQLLSEDTQNESTQPPSQWEESLANQDANLSFDEPMDTSEGEGGTGATTKESDDGNVGSAMEMSDNMITSNTTISELEDSGHNQALPAEGSAHAENITSGAEALVRVGESNSGSSMQIKQEILTEVMTEVQANTEAEPLQAAEDTSTTSNPVLEKDQDVKPPKAELDSVLDQTQSKQTSLGEAESTPASQAKKSKGFSITSIVGRLFDKKEEEARKRKETSPEEPPDEIANVSFKISGVKSLAAPEQAAKQQQRQEMRQTTASPFVIAKVTSLATEVEKCSKCSKQIESEKSAYKWQKELFCSFSCLDTTRITSTKTVTCDSCTVVLHPRIRNVHFAKVGKEMREFCSTRCSKNSEESPKLCPGCGKDVSSSSNPVLAQTGSEGIFFEFCTQDCVNQYEERILGDTNKDHEISVLKQIRSTCNECENLAEIRYEFSFHQVKKLFCSEACFDAFRMKYNTKIDRCATCKCMCSNDASAGMTMTLDGQTYQFCSEKCKGTFAQHCTYCSAKRPVKTMLEDGDSKKYFCALACKDSYQKKHGGNTNAAMPQLALPPMTPLNSIHVPSATSEVPQSITSNQPPQQQAQKQPLQTVVNTAGPQPSKCNHCQKVQRPLYHLTMSDRTLRDFCSYNCVISFQSQFNVPPVTLPEETLLLRCHKCQRGFNSRPFVLDYEDKTSLFCSELCLEDYKRTNCVFVQCDQCHQEKILFERTHFSGEPRTFCSQGCMLLFKQEIVQTLGLQCIVCDYCAQMCKKEVSDTIGGIKRHFCQEECKSKYELWFYKVARCDGCKNTGRQLTEKFMWRGHTKHVCNQQCLLLFYTQQNIPNVTTQLPQPIPTSTAQHQTPTIAKVMSLLPIERLSAPRTVVKENKKLFTNKQTQITTNTVYIKPPPPPPPNLPSPPKMMRNKITSCRPIQITKATMCRPIVKDMCVGTDFPKVPAIVPIPFPVFIPVPMQMYTSHIPHPLAVPIPVPVPMFIPVAARDCDRLLKTIQEIKDRIPSDPLEAELFMMAAAAASPLEDDVSDLGTSEHDGTGKRGSVSEKEGSIGSLGQRTRASLVDQAMVECGLMDEPMEDMGVDELLAILSSPEVSDEILLLNTGLEDDDEKENKELLAELTQGLDALGHIPEYEADPPPPAPITKKVTKITLKKKPKRRKRATKRKRASAPSPAQPPAPAPDLDTGLRRSSRGAKRTKVYISEDSQDQEDADDVEEEYEPEITSSSEEEIVEMVDEVIDPQGAVQQATLPRTDDAWVTAGLLAYKLFVLGLNEGAKPVLQRLKPDILECSQDVIHRGLIQFVRDARQPNGQPYPPETLLLIYISIQRHLTDNGRLDNFLAGPNYDQFRNCLHMALAPWVPTVHPTTGLLLNSRINEEMMWASQQLGAHSPHVLLSTIFFFNCRNLRMRSVAEHSKLAFFRMQKLVKKAPVPSGKVSLLRYFPPKKKNEAEAGKKGAVLNIGNRKKREYDAETLDQSENTENPLRCPVKLYEFYLSKCPESIKMRNEIFYLLPEHSCIPDSPVWYSATTLPDEEVERMLRRYGMIQEVQAGWQQKMKEEEEERAAEREREKEGAGDEGGDRGGVDKASVEGSSTEQSTDEQTK
ncbi:zinc finger MYM-type protein 3 isoform X3 [Strongylocentrotus purpuratus]|uniref:TRASH domain-containing protein n=1 Tax=Strongylocentrotus purpuratus TaxID=7668 RepID=A0A7M7T3K4_STRPU|nr:zinc finger MYM-type protein 3 isoform X3 [Strongylocentrotus purpuratus]